MKSAKLMPVLLYLMSGMILWTAFFMIAYGAVGVICARDMAALSLFGLPVSHVAVTVLAIAALAGVPILLRRTRSSGDNPETVRFLHSGAAVLGFIAAVAILWNLLPFVILEHCFLQEAG